MFGQENNPLQVFESEENVLEIGYQLDIKLEELDEKKGGKREFPLEFRKLRTHVLASVSLCFADVGGHYGHCGHLPWL